MLPVATAPAAVDQQASLVPQPSLITCSLSDAVPDDNAAMVPPLLLPPRLIDACCSDGSLLVVDRLRIAKAGILRASLPLYGSRPPLPPGLVADVREREEEASVREARASTFAGICDADERGWGGSQSSGAGGP